MKKVIIIGILMVCTCFTAVSRDLHQGEKLVKSIMELEFDEQCMATNAFVTWELVGDWDLFDYSFSQGELSNKGKLLTINANEYKDFLDGYEGIALSIQGKPKTPQGNYRLSMIVSEVSDELDFVKEDLDLDMNINYILPPPPPLWKRLLVPCIILAVLVLIAILVLHITAKFPKGLLQLGREEVDLTGKKMVSLKEELDKLGVELESGTDVILVKKRFGSYQGPTVKEMKNCALERDGVYLSRGAVILPDEEIHGLKDLQGNEILIRYC